MWRPLVFSIAICGGCASDPEFEPLFNGRNLDGWYSYLPSYGIDEDPLGIFKVNDGMIHLLDVDTSQPGLEFGYLASERSYENFHLRFEYRWGTRQFVGFRDSGFFIAMVGPDQIWPRSQECQVMENDTGSMYMFDFATVDTTIDPGSADPRYLDGGTPHTTPRQASPFPRVTHSAAHDSLTEWNTVEIISIGESSEFIVNGNTTFRSSTRRQPDPDAPDDPSRDLPLTRGKLIIQQEGAEIFYRNIELKQLDPQ